MKYKPGDKVKVRSDLEWGQIYLGFWATEEMSLLKGKTVTIRVCTKQKSGVDTYLIEESGFLWTEEMFEEKEFKYNYKKGTKFKRISETYCSLDKEEFYTLAEDVKTDYDGDKVIFENRSICSCLWLVSFFEEVKETPKFKICDRVLVKKDLDRTKIYNKYFRPFDSQIPKRGKIGRVVEILRTDGGDERYEYLLEFDGETSWHWTADMLDLYKEESGFGHHQIFPEEVKEIKEISPLSLGEKRIRGLHSDIMFEDEAQDIERGCEEMVEIEEIKSFNKSNLSKGKKLAEQEQADYETQQAKLKYTSLISEKQKVERTIQEWKDVLKNINEQLELFK